MRVGIEFFKQLKIHNAHTHTHTHTVFMQRLRMDASDKRKIFLYRTLVFLAKYFIESFSTYLVNFKFSEYISLSTANPKNLYTLRNHLPDIFKTSNFKV